MVIETEGKAEYWWRITERQLLDYVNFGGGCLPITKYERDLRREVQRNIDSGMIPSHSEVVSLTSVKIAHYIKQRYSPQQAALWARIEYLEAQVATNDQFHFNGAK